MRKYCEVCPGCGRIKPLNGKEKCCDFTSTRKVKYK